MIRKKLIAGNWKMNLEIIESLNLVNELNAELNEMDFQKAYVLVCPAFTALNAVNEIIKNTNLMLGAQNIFYENDGAYTGEISANMIKTVGCKYVILGHSERRKYFRETDDIINLKMRKAFQYELNPILCVGETFEQRERGEQNFVVKTQLAECLKNLDADEIISTSIAYEPVWAIGTGNNATPDEAQQMHEFIRNEVIKEMIGNDCSKVRIIYGGSLNENNSEEILSKPDIDGGLVGGASLKFDSFTKIIRSIK